VSSCSTGSSSSSSHSSSSSATYEPVGWAIQDADDVEMKAVDVAWLIHEVIGLDDEVDSTAKVEIVEGADRVADSEAAVEETASVDMGGRVAETELPDDEDGAGDTVETVDTISCCPHFCKSAPAKHRYCSRTHATRARPPAGTITCRPRACGVRETQTNVDLQSATCCTTIIVMPTHLGLNPRV